MEKPPLAKGNFLIAEPFLGDPNFERSVVLLCEHNAEGSFGFVLNQPSALSLQDVWEESLYVDLPLYVGGPVEQNTLHFIHRRPEVIEGAIPVLDDLFWGGDYEQLRTLLNLGKIAAHEVRFFVGYSGWSAGQLAGEYAQNTWIVSPAKTNLIFEVAAQDFWRQVLRDMGGEHRVLANYPIDPRLN
ncbi:MAG: YqgE/AlgH family protein [Microscillaceae bacterium]